MEQTKETQTTVVYIVVALVFAGLATISSTNSAPSLDLSQFQVGEFYYPELNANIDQVAGLEVYSPNEELGITNNFKVQKKGDVWVIPSQKDYPADAVKKLGEVAASLFDLKRNKFVTSQVSEFKKLKVLDPTEKSEDSDATGVGIKVNLLDISGNNIASFIFGNAVEGKRDSRYIRRADEKRVYETKIVSVDLSTKFSDWIETDLLTIEEADIRAIEINDYEVDLARGTLSDMKLLNLIKKDNDWVYTGTTETEETNTEATKKIVSGLDDIVITGVVRKPEIVQKFFSGENQNITDNLQRELQPRGFYFLMQGQKPTMVSTVGEVAVKTVDGVHYTLWFGRLEYSAESSSSDLLKDKKDVDTKKASESGDKKPGSADRYLVIKVDLDPSVHPEPVKPKLEGLKEEESKKRQAEYESQVKDWKAKKQKSQEKVDKLNRRFAEWYYKISDEDYRKIRCKRSDLVQAKPEEAPETKPGDNPFDSAPGPDDPK